ncbi:MAG: hypothetical protein WBA73_02840 [Devosia sp.]
MALFKGSRYEDVPQFQADPSAKVVFRGLRPRPIGNPEAVLEHTIAQKDRLDALGHNYYLRSNDWYRIAEANPEFLFPEDILHILEPALPETPTDAQEDAILDVFEADNAADRVGATILIPRREDS